MRCSNILIIRADDFRESLPGVFLVSYMDSEALRKHFNKFASATFFVETMRTTEIHSSLGTYRFVKFERMKKSDHLMLEFRSTDKIQVLLLLVPGS